MSFIKLHENCVPMTVEHNARHMWILKTSTENLNPGNEVEVLTY